MATSAEAVAAIAPRKTFVCSHCGSDEVLHDAWAVWSVETQEWELQNVLDATYCQRCDAECGVREVDLAD